MVADFERPDVTYRLKPFWFWNGEMDREEIRHQIREMKEKGVGGFFICPRQGMKVAYLSSAWFDLVKFACEEAKKEGIEAWLYDEYPYPSGMAGGEVLLEHPESGHKILRLYRYEEQGPVSRQYRLPFVRVLFAKAFPVSEDGKLDYGGGIDLTEDAGNLQVRELYQESGLTAYSRKRFFTADPARVFETELPQGRWSVWIYTEEPLGDFKYYGAFFDPCDKAAVKTFLESTHERYERHLGAGFGGMIRGMFSDEVGLLGPIPWSGKLPAYFEEKNGYSILEKLPALHDAGYPDAYRIRYDLYHAVHELFVESYHKQVAGWCSERGLYFATEVPSMRMTTQRYSTVVGGDTGHEKLGCPLEQIFDTCLHHYRCNPYAVGSLRRQLDRDYAMIESFHSIGWTMTIQDAKWIMDRLAAAGINLFNLHAFCYTIDTLAKHDAPPSQFLQNPYWKHYRLLTDYAARLSALVTNTEPCTEVAVLDPVASLWVCMSQPFQGFCYSGSSEEEKKLCDRIRDDWSFICKTLLFHQISYEHLDAEILAQAKIADGRIRIGKSSYSILILPPAICMEKGAVEKVRQFAAKGGRLLALGMLPEKEIDDGESPAAVLRTVFGTEDTGVDIYGKECAESGGHLAERDGYLTENGERTAFFGGCRSVAEAAAEQWIGWCKSRLQEKVRVCVSAEQGKCMVSSVRAEQDQSRVIFLSNQSGERLAPRIETGDTDSGEDVFAEEYSIKTGKRTGCILPGGRVALMPYQSRLLHIRKSAGALDAEVKNAGMHSGSLRLTVPMDGEMPVTIEGGNIFRFADFEMSLDGAHWVRTEPKTFLEQYISAGQPDGAKLRFSDAFGIPRSMEIAYPQKVRYRRSWFMEAVPESAELLMDRHAIEGETKIRLNGSRLEKGCWKKCRVYDQNNISADVRPFLKEGENLLEIEVCVEKEDGGIRDPFYLTGSFGVRFDGDEKPVITELPERAAYRAFYVEGFPFYSGTFTFHTALTLSEEQHIKLLQERTAELVLSAGTELYYDFELFINGRSAGVRAFAPYLWRVDADMLKAGKNEVAVKIAVPLSNMLDGTYFDYEEHRVVPIEPVR